jgi:hypothetical protein
MYDGFTSGTVTTVTVLTAFAAFLLSSADTAL